MFILLKLWACSSAGRAPALQAGGHRFDPGHVHHIFQLLKHLEFMSKRLASTWMSTRTGRTRLSGGGINAAAAAEKTASSGGASSGALSSHRTESSLVHG